VNDCQDVDLEEAESLTRLCRSANEVEAVAATYFDEVRPLAIGKAT
jgi:hypothetical protein